MDPEPCVLVTKQSRQSYITCEKTVNREVFVCRAYAVTCWEVMALGADPFYGQVNLEVINLVLGGNVLQKSEHCPDSL